MDDISSRTSNEQWLCWVLCWKWGLEWNVAEGMVKEWVCRDSSSAQVTFRLIVRLTVRLIVRLTVRLIVRLTIRLTSINQRANSFRRITTFTRMSGYHTECPIFSDSDYRRRFLNPRSRCLRSRLSEYNKLSDYRRVLIYSKTPYPANIIDIVCNLIPFRR